MLYLFYYIFGKSAFLQNPTFSNTDKFLSKISVLTTRLSILILRVYHLLSVDGLSVDGLVMALQLLLCNKTREPH